MKAQHVPELRFPGFEGEWVAKKLGDLLEFKNGINADKEQYGQGVKFVNVLDVLSNEYLIYDNIIGSVDVTAELAKKFPVEYGDILFQRSSETREEVGSATVYLDKDRKATFGGFVIRGRKIGEYEPVFLNKLLKTDSARDAITSKSGGSTRYNVGQETLSNIYLRFASIPEQQKIAAFLTAIDEKLQALRKAKSLLEAYKKGVMQQIFSQELRFKDADGKDFGDWEEKRLGEITSTFKSGDGITAKDISEVGTYPVYGGNGLRGFTQSFTHDGFYILIGRQGALCGNINRVFGKSFISEHAIAVQANQNSDTEWLAQKLELMNLNQFSESSAQPGLSVNKLLRMKISVPSLPEQTKIATFLSTLDERLAHYGRQIVLTEGWKKGLMQRMFV